LSAAPAELRPILEHMLQPDPADRPRSMEEVLAEVAEHGHAPTQLGTGTRLKAGGAAPAAPPPPSNAGTGAAPARGGASKVLVIGGVAALALVAAIGGYLMFGRTSVAGPDEEKAARAAIVAGLPNVACSWLDIASLKANGDAIDVAVRGVAGKPAEAERQIKKLIADAGLTAGSVDFDDVSRIDAAADCGPLEAFKSIRDYDGKRLQVSQRKYEMSKLPARYQDAGKLAAIPIIEIDARQFDDDMGLFGLEESGAIQNVVTTREQLKGEGIKEPRPDVFNIPLQTDHQGWSGVLLLKGRGPFDPQVIEKHAGGGNQQWVDRFLQAAKERGWKSEMVWYRTVDDKPG
jgi:serine/threonine-protein kinase